MGRRGIAGMLLVLLVGAELLPKYFSVAANCGVHALSYSRFVIIQGRWEEGSGKYLQIHASVGSGSFW